MMGGKIEKSFTFYFNGTVYYVHNMATIKWFDSRYSASVFGHFDKKKQSIAIYNEINLLMWKLLYVKFDAFVYSRCRPK